MKFFLVLALLIPGLCAFGQQMVELEEKVPYSYNGLDYGFYISNEQSKEVKGEPFERYEVMLYVTNKSGCANIIPFKSNFLSSDDEVVISEFTCKNATGKRLTAKSGKVQAQPYFTQVKIPDENATGKQPKFKMVNAQVGYAIRNGQTLSNKIIVIVPKGERPSFTCRLVYFQEL